jgi:ABC-type Fe3+-hydroxamate transport system substrate-binding protein
VPSLRVTDDLGRDLRFAHPPARIVSLVPSDTYNVIALGARDRLVGRTTYCEADPKPPVPPSSAGRRTSTSRRARTVAGPRDRESGENTRQALEALAASSGFRCWCRCRGG